MGEDIATVIYNAEQMLCPKGEPYTGDDNRQDHGHATCWVIGGLLNEIERLRAEVARLASFLHPIGTVVNLRCDCNEYRPCLHCREARRG